MFWQDALVNVCFPNFVLKVYLWYDCLNVCLSFVQSHYYVTSVKMLWCFNGVPQCALCLELELISWSAPILAIFVIS